MRKVTTAKVSAVLSEHFHMGIMSDNKVSLDYVYSPFRTKDTNPKDWDYKMNYWLGQIKDKYELSNELNVSYKKISELFLHNGRPPYGLPEVFQEMIKKNIIIPKSQIKSNNIGEPESSWLGWGTETFIKYPLSYINNWLSWYSPNDPSNLDTLENSEFIYFENLKKLSDKIWERLKIRFLGHNMDEHGLYTFDQLKESCGDICNDNQIFILTLEYLKKKGLLSFDSSLLNSNGARISTQDIIIKFLGHVQSPQPTSFTEVDLNIIKLKRAEKLLDSAIEKLSVDIDRCLINVKHHLQLNDRSKAKMYLKKKRNLQLQLEKREIARENIANLLDQISHARSNKMIYDAYKSGINAFKSTFDDMGVDADKINDTIDDIQEVVDMQAEIDRAISSGPSGSSTSSPYPLLDYGSGTGSADPLMLELEAELNALIEEEAATAAESGNGGTTVRSIYPTLPAQALPSAESREGKGRYGVPADFLDTTDDSLEDLFPQIPDTEPGDVEPSSTKRKTEPLKSSK